MNNEENQSLVPLKFVEPAAQPATAPVAIPAQTGISIDTPELQTLLSAWVRAIPKSRAALIAHIDAYGQQQREAGSTDQIALFKKCAEVDQAEFNRKWTEQRERAEKAEAALAAQQVEPFQARVQPWLLACFGAEIAADQVERNHRFLEESIELVQASGCTASEAHQLVDYVFGRPVGEPAQEVGGVMVTLAALCLARGMDMAAAGEAELARIWTKVEQIRAKQAAKPKYGPLPGPAPVDQTGPCDVCDDTRTAFGKRCACAEGMK